MSSPWPEPLYVMMQQERQRQQGSQRQLYALNDGWPFGDGPLRWFCHLEVRPDSDATIMQVHAVCDQCPQAIWCMIPDTEQRGFTWNLELLKSRVADHVLKCHPEAAT